MCVEGEERGEVCVGGEGEVCTCTVCMWGEGRWDDWYTCMCGLEGIVVCEGEGGSESGVGEGEQY